MAKYVNFIYGILLKKMKINLKIKVFMKVWTDDEIDEKDAAISSYHLLLNIFLGVNLGKFQDIWVFLKAVLNFS